MLQEQLTEEIKKFSAITRFIHEKNKYLSDNAHYPLEKQISQR